MIVVDLCQISVSTADTDMNGVLCVCVCVRRTFIAMHMLIINCN